MHRSLNIILLGIVLGALIASLPCIYVGYLWGKQRSPTVDDMYTTCAVLLTEKDSLKHAKNLDEVRRFSVAALQSAFFHGDMYNYKYDPEGWEELFSALLEKELNYLQRSKNKDKAALSALSRHLDAYWRAMPFWDSNNVQRANLFRSVLGSIYLKKYEEIDRTGFNAFISSHNSSVHVTEQPKPGGAPNPHSPSAQGAGGR